MYCKNTERSEGASDKDGIFPYHYGEEAEQYTFYRIPKILFTSPKFRKLSCEAKLLYGLLLDRMQLSVKNRWLDADGKVYIYFSQEQIAEMMGCGLKKVGSLLAELDSRKGIGLITRIRQGLGKPDRIYVRRCICVDLSEGNIQTRQNDISGYIKMADTDMSKVPGNDTDKNKTEINDTEYLSFLSADESEESRRKQIEREAYYKIICHNIGYEYLIEECDREMLDEIVALVVDVISSDREFIWIGRDRKPFDVVKSQFLKLNAEHIRFVMKCLRENTSKVVNIRQYLLTVLYNAPLTISNYYSALVQHDMYGNED